MKLSQGAYGMLAQRYRAVLKKCHLLNVLGGAIVSGAMLLGVPAMAQAADIPIETSTLATSAVTIAEGDSMTIKKVSSDVDYTLNATDPGAHPAITSSFEDLTINNGKLVIANDGARVNCGDVTVKGGGPLDRDADPNLYSASNLHVGSIGARAVNNGLRAWSLLIDQGAKVKVERKVGLFQNGVITVEDGELRAGILESLWSNGILNVGGKGVLHVTEEFKLGDEVQTGTFKLNVANNATVVFGDPSKGSVCSMKDALISVADAAASSVEGSFTGDVDITTGNNATLKLSDGTASVQKVEGIGNIAVGTSGPTDKTGTLTAEKVAMTGGSITFDPDFAAAGDTSNASMGGLKFEDSTIKTSVIAGQNSMVSLGSTDAEWLRSEVNKYQSEGKGTWKTDITAALAVRAPQTLDTTGAIKVDGSWTHGATPTTANTAAFADKSLFVVDATGVGSGVALTGSTGSTLTVNANARLLVAGGKDGQMVKITSGFDSGTSTNNTSGWVGGNLATSTALLSATANEFDNAGGSYSITLKSNEPTSAFPSLSGEMAAVARELAYVGVDVNSGNAGVKFLSRVLSDNHIGRGDAQAAAATIEGASRMVATSAPQMAAAASTAGVGAVIARTSIGNLNSSLMAMDTQGNNTSMNAGDSDNSKTGVGLWIMPLWQSVNNFGQKAGEFKSDMHGNIGGVAIGADYTFENALRAGITFNIGGGYAEGSGDFAKTTNSMNFWGVGLYGSWAMDNFGVSADVNYTSTFNKMKQELDNRMGMADLKSDVYSSAITAGLRGEYKVVTDALDITPHLGVRLIYLHTDEYDVKSAGSKVYKGDAINQTIWSFPVGVTLSKTVNMDNGWYVKPSLDLQVTPRAGEVHAKNDIKYTGLNTSASIETQTMDYITYGGAAGIEFGNDNVKLGLNYNLEAGAHTTNHGVFGTLRYEF